MDKADTKFDFLVTEICDKITTCIELMQKDNVLPAQLSLREVYNTYLHPDKIDLNDKKLWNALGNGEVLDVFQFSTGVGLDAAKEIKPQNPIEMTSANALLRLMGEPGKERPMSRYIRLRKDMNLWYSEVRNAGLNEKEIKVLEPYYLPNFGVPANQEDLMLICMDKDIANFSLKEANQARKIIAKKYMDEIPVLKQKFISQCSNFKLGEYVWETAVGPQLGYSFSKLCRGAYTLNH